MNTSLTMVSKRAESITTNRNHLHRIGIKPILRKYDEMYVGKYDFHLYNICTYLLSYFYPV